MANVKSLRNNRTRDILAIFSSIFQLFSLPCIEITSASVLFRELRNADEKEHEIIWERRAERSNGTATLPVLAISIAPIERSRQILSITPIRSFTNT